VPGVLSLLSRLSRLPRLPGVLSLLSRLSRLPRLSGVLSLLSRLPRLPRGGAQEVLGRRGGWTALIPGHIPR